MKLFSCCIENDAASRVLSVVAQSIQSQGVNFVSKRVNFVSNPTVALQSTLLHVQCWRSANSDHYNRQYFLYADHQRPVKCFCMLTPGKQIGMQIIRPKASISRQSQRPAAIGASASEACAGRLSDRARPSLGPVARATAAVPSV